MDLKAPKISLLFMSYFVYMYVTAMTNAQKYTQSEIDTAWAKMVKRERYYSSQGNERGCWPKSVIPFKIDPRFSPEQLQHIFNDMVKIIDKTCIRFLTDTYITANLTKKLKFIYNPDDDEDCHFVERGQDDEITTELHLGDDCFPTQAVIHEMLHALGRTHEHQRIDRDCYVEVNKHVKYDGSMYVIYDDYLFERWPYDKRSIVHYIRQQFAIKDRDEGFFGLPWNYRLGDEYGGFLYWGHPLGELTAMDIAKLNFRFCGGPDYCDVHPTECDEIEADEKRDGCKEIYELIANGTLVPSNPKSNK